MPRTRQSAFSSGEITPALHSRVDAAQYQQGLAQARNFFVSVYGGLLNRPGTRLIAETTRNSRLIPFQVSENDGVALEFDRNGIFFHAQGGQLIAPPVGATIGSQVGTGVGQWRNMSNGGAYIVNVPQLNQIGGEEGVADGFNIEGGGLAAAFDGETTSISALCANVSSYVGSVTKGWGYGRRVHGFLLYGSSDLGLTGRRQSVSIVLIGSNSNFILDRTPLAQWTVQDEPGVVVQRFLDPAKLPTYRYHGLLITGAQTGPIGSGDDIVSIAECFFYDNDLSNPGLELHGAPSSACAAEQEVTTTTPNVEHVISWFMGSPGGINFRVGHTSDSDTILAKGYYPTGWNTVSFIPRVSPFFIRFSHEDEMPRVFDGRTRFLGTGATAPVPFTIPQPYGDSDIGEVNFTQDANRLTLVSRLYYPLDLKRGPDPLTWALEIKSFGPTLSGPPEGVVSATKNGSDTATTTHVYVVTYVSEAGEESLPGVPVSSPGIATLTATQFIRIAIAQPLPAGVLGCNVYKFYGGNYGLLGFCVSVLDDTGLSPKVDQAPPGTRNPFVPPGGFPTCATYWEQRLALAGSDNAPETVELSKPGASNNFCRSSPPRADDSITFTPAGPSVRRIRHMIATSDLAMFTDAGVVVARRGDSGLTPSIDGGVRQVLTRGIGKVRPLIVDNNLVFVSTDGRSVRLLDRDYQDSELSLLGEHLFRGRQVVDWCWQEVPWSLLWLVMSDGQLVTLSLLPDQGVLGWAPAITDGQVKSIACIREGGTDRVYLRCRRWLRGGWRNTVEIMAERKLSDVRDSFFVDCGLSYDVPVPIAALTTTNPATITLSRSGAVVGSEFDLDGTGIDGIDGRRFTVIAVDGSTLTLNAQWAGLPPWRGTGVARRAVATVTGLDHLEGHAVAVLNTGNVELDHVVQGGAITLQKPGTRVHVGLPYESLGRTLRIAVDVEPFGRRKSVREVQILTRDTRGIEFGPDLRTWDRAKARTLEERFSEPVGLKTQLQEFTVSSRWDVGGQMYFRQPLPLPVEILSISPVFEQSGG